MDAKQLLQKVTNKIEVCKNDIVGVGVSGGADSMVLLHALILLKEKIDFKLIVVHVNHQLRGIESDRDEEFVQSFCKLNNLIVESVKVDVLKNKAEQKLTLEESARNMRYEVFNDIAKKYGINKFFLAHHANDQAETILMHLLRGSGTIGVIGMLASENFLRPMLGLTREEILDIAKQNNIKFVTDSTNAQNICNRNKIRNEILPLIENIYPGATKALVRFAENVKKDNDFINEVVPYDLLKEYGDKVEIDIKAFSLHPALCFRLIKKAFAGIGVNADILQNHISQLIEMQKFNNGDRLNFPHGVVAVKEYDKICLYRKLQNVDLSETPFSIGELQLGKYVLNIEYVDGTDVIFGKDCLYFEEPDNACWRTMRPEDKFQKLGARGSKKLVDYFTDKKIPLMKRNQIPVLARKNEVLVVAGYDISEKVKLTKNSSKIVRLTCLTKA